MKRCAIGFLIGVSATPLVGQSAVVAKDDTSVRRIESFVRQLGEKDVTAPEFALLRVGRRAVPSLLRAVIVKGRMPDTRLARNACRILGRVGPDAARVYPDLVGALPLARGESFFTLAHTLADLVPYSDDQGRPRSVERLLLNAQYTTTERRSGNNRQRFQYSLERLQQRAQVDPSAGMKEMIAEVRRNRTHRREVAAEVLGRIGPAAKAAVPVLVASLQKGAPVVGQIGGFSVPKYRDGFPQAASRALVAIAPKDKRCAVAWGWSAENARVAEERRRGLVALSTLGADAASQLLPVIGALRDRDAEVRFAAMHCLACMGAAGERGLADLRRVAKSEDRGTAARAKAAIQRIERAVQAAREEKVKVGKPVPPKAGSKKG